MTHMERAAEMVRVHPWPGGWCVDVYPPAGAPFVGAGPFDTEAYAVEQAELWRAAVASVLDEAFAEWER
jgi:hypothetical protein